MYTIEHTLEDVGIGDRDIDIECTVGYSVTWGTPGDHINPGEADRFFVMCVVPSFDDVSKEEIQETINAVFMPFTLEHDRALADKIWAQQEELGNLKG